MRKYLWAPSLVVALLAGTSMAEAQQVADSRVADLVRRESAGRAVPASVRQGSGHR